MFMEKVMDNYKWRALAAIAVGSFMAPLNGSITNIALPSITAFFSVSLVTAEWVIMSYLLVISSLLLTYGRLGDMIGHKPVYVGGFAGFTVGAFLCGVAPSIEALIAFRVLQGLGAGMMFAIGPAIVTSSFPPQERGKALGLLGMVVAVALATGPALGGFLVGLFGWRAVFLINLPIGVFGTFWALRTLRWSREQTKQNFDFLGAGLFSFGLTVLLLILSQGENWGWRSPQILIPLAAALVSLALFIRVELRVPDPMLDLSLFKIRLFSAANVSALINFMAQSAVYFLFPFYLLDMRLLAPQHAGMIIMVSPLVIFVVAPVAGSLSDRIGSRLLSSTGMGLVAVSLFLLSRVQLDTPVLFMAAAFAFLGLGAGLFQAPNNSAIMGSVPRRRLGIASGMLATMRNVGMVLGIAVAGAVFAVREAHHLFALDAAGLTGRVLTTGAFTAAMNDAFLVGAGLAALGVVTSLVRGAGVPGQEIPAAPQAPPAAAPAASAPRRTR